MKNVLSYYYNLNPINIHQNNKYYKFNINEDNYIVFKINDLDNIQNAYDISNYLNYRGIYVHKIILNNQNSITTFYNNSYYVLVKTIDNLDKKIKLEDIIYFNNITINKEKKENWYQLWIKKLDYFNYQIKEMGKRYPILKESFNFFSGFAETGIQLLININFNTKLSICHKRINYDDNLFEFYNPFNLIIDNNVRDVAEYFKSLFIIEDPYYLIKKYILNNSLSESELQLFFIRLLYPSFYFDKYEYIIRNNKDDSLIIPIIKKANDYEELIKKTYTLIKSICYLPEIEWLVK